MEEAALGSPVIDRVTTERPCDFGFLRSRWACGTP